MTVPDPAPPATFTATLDGYPADVTEITKPADLTGSITGTGVALWKLIAKEPGSDAFVTLAEGTNAFEQQRIGAFDRRSG